MTTATATATASTAVWSDSLQAVIDVNGLEVLDGTKFVFRCPSVCGGAELYCYCACRVPYDDTRWVLAVAPNIDDRHDPQHAVEFRFPFQLPLYPKGDIAFVAVSLKTDATPDAALQLRPLYLADVPPVPLQAVHALTAKEWRACEGKWTACFSNTCAVLSAAFDNMWDCTVHVNAGLSSGGDASGLQTGVTVTERGDVVLLDLDAGAFVSTDAIEEVDYDADAVALNTTLLLSRPCSDEGHVATATDDMLNDDDDTKIDVHTGLAASGVACDDNDDDMESIDGDTDADDDEEEEDDDEDDDDDDDAVE